MRIVSMMLVCFLPIALRSLSPSFPVKPLIFWAISMTCSWKTMREAVGSRMVSRMVSANSGWMGSIGSRPPIRSAYLRCAFMPMGPGR